MEKRVEAADGRRMAVRVNDDNVINLHDRRPAIESDPDDLDEGATTALILVEDKPSTMTVEGAITAFGVTARHVFGKSGAAPTQGTWWNDWGKYVVGLALLLAVVGGLRVL